jgi:hypothetical protein
MVALMMQSYRGPIIKKKQNVLKRLLRKLMMRSWILKKWMRRMMT